MEMRRHFSAGDLHYLANLCHQCGACQPDCQYAPPHQFDVNIPRALARVRNESYAVYVWPRAFAFAFARNGLVVALLAAISVAAFITGFVVLQDSGVLFAAQAGDFYALMPHAAMVAVFGIAALYVVGAFVASMRACWRDIGGGQTRVGFMDWMRAVRDAGELRYLGGGGGGCMSEDDRPSAARRVFHHFTFYGFLSCFAATCVATVYHYGFGWEAPYDLTSAPVVLGILGGIGLLIGPAGLFVLTRRRAAALTDPRHADLNTAFIAMLFFTGLSGLLLMMLRDTAVMGLLLAAHLGFVLGLFLSLPYGKFVHGLYRYLALAKYAAERRRGAFVG